MKNDLEKLSKGFDVRTPEYIIDGRGISKPNSLPVSATKIIVAEGIASMYGDVKDIFDINLKILAFSTIICFGVVSLINYFINSAQGK